MEEVLEIVVLGRAARNGANRKNRQPLAAMYVKTDVALDDDLTAIVADELNVREVLLSADADSFVGYSFKPQLKTVGPKYGRRLNEIRTALAELDGAAAKKELDEKGTLTLPLPNGDVVLAPEDLLIETTQREGFYTLSDRGTTVALDIRLTPELIEEGYVRELVSKIQTMRKEAGFEVMDHIRVTLSGSGTVTDVALRHTDDIATDVLAVSLTVGDPVGSVKEWDINGETVTIGVEKV